MTRQATLSIVCQIFNKRKKSKSGLHYRTRPIPLIITKNLNKSSCVFDSFIIYLFNNQGLDSMKRLSIILSALLFAGCWGASTGMVLVKNCIGYYYSFANEPIVHTKTDGDNIQIFIDPVNSNDCIIYSKEFAATESDFHKISSELGDTGFSKKKIRALYGVIENYSVYPYPSEIEITSDSDWDSLHPAGELINDCFTIKYCSYLEYIESDYKIEDLLYKPIEKNLSELKSNDLKFLDYYINGVSYEEIIDQLRYNGQAYPIVLTAVSQPAPHTTHNLTIVWHLHNGTECTSCAEVTVP